jgi:hypothetical protein
MRVRGALVVLLVLCAVSASAAVRRFEAFTYYADGRFVTERAGQLEAREKWGVSGGHQPWRLAPALVAAYDGARLRPTALPDGEEDRTANGRVIPSFRTVGGRADYDIAQLAGDRAVVTLKLDGKLTHRITLRRPFGHWWYITEMMAQRARPRRRWRSGSVDGEDYDRKGNEDPHGAGGGERAGGGGEQRYRTLY